MEAWIMEFFDLMSISHRYMEILDPSTPEKSLNLANYLNWKKGAGSSNFGCGCAEPLTLWAKEFRTTLASALYFTKSFETPV